MHAMRLLQAKSPLKWVESSEPVAKHSEIRLKVSACGVCRTDLHIQDDELPGIQLPVTPGHEIVGYVEQLGAGVTEFVIGDRVGIPWLGSTCGTCRFCLMGSENLCDHAKFTGYTRDGGFATHVVADARFAFKLPQGSNDVDFAPLLCAGLIGWRSLVAAGQGTRLGIYGFGAAAHIVAQVALWQGRSIAAFTRPGDTKNQSFARQCGADWVGGSDEMPSAPLDAAIIFAPVGELVPLALRAVRKGGRVVCAGIHMSDIPSFPYSLLWQERQLVSVANLTRKDGEEFLRLVPQIGIKTTTTVYSLKDANQALMDLNRPGFPR